MTDDETLVRALVTRVTGEMHASPDLLDRVTRRRRRRAVVSSTATVAAVVVAGVIATSVALTGGSTPQRATPGLGGVCPSGPASPGRSRLGPSGGGLVPGTPGAVVLCTYAGSREADTLTGRGQVSGAALRRILDALNAPLTQGVRHCGPQPRQYSMVTLRFEYSTMAPFTVTLELNGCQQVSNGTVTGWYNPDTPVQAITDELERLGLGPSATALPQPTPS